MNDPVAMATLLALALLCLAVRWAGFLAASADRIPPRLRRFIEGVPAPLLAALVASSAAAEGAGAMVAVGAAVLLMIVLRNEIIAAVGGVGLALLLS
jgi:uncharacterized membrane protein